MAIHPRFSYGMALHLTRQDSYMLPFGYIVAAYQPLDSQTVLGGRSHEAVFVGIAPPYTGGLSNQHVLRCC